VQTFILFRCLQISIKGVMAQQVSTAEFNSDEAEEMDRSYQATAVTGTQLW